MPWTDWPLDDRKAAASDIATAVWSHVIASTKLTAEQVLNRLYAKVVGK